MYLFGVFGVSLFLASCVAGLDEEAAKELRCLDAPDPDIVGLNLTWLGTVDPFYIPLWSKLYATRVASDIFLRDPSSIGYNEVQPSSCLAFNKNNIIQAWGRQGLYNITADETGLTFRGPWVGSKSGKFSFHLTDNKSYVLGITCWEDDEASWALLTKNQFLDPNIKFDVYAYVRSLGFDLNKAVSEDYSRCYGVTNFPVIVRQPTVHLPPVIYRYVYRGGWRK